jgi:hypothetical protein
VSSPQPKEINRFVRGINSGQPVYLTKFNKDDEAMICWARISSGILKMQRERCVGTTVLK